MAKFEPCFDKVILVEGGYKLTNNSGDRGGQTYAGISRIKNQSWPGWEKVDKREFDDALKQLVKTFYREEFWNKIQGDIIGFQSVAYSLFEFGVNTGIGTAIRRCQKIIGVETDGVFGDKTLKALNKYVTDKKDEEIFILRLGLMKISRHNYIAQNDPRREHDMLVSDMKHICGWINRDLGSMDDWNIGYP